MKDDVGIIWYFHVEVGAVQDAFVPVMEPPHRVVEMGHMPDPGGCSGIELFGRGAGMARAHDHAVLPAQMARGAGRIVLLSSGAGLMGVFGYTAYGASSS